jgi:hypothetical protein
MVSGVQLQEQGRHDVLPEIEKLTMKSTISAGSLKSLINSFASDFEDRLLLQDSIDGIGRDAEAFISYLYCMASPDKRNKLLSVYRQMLKDMISEVDALLKKKDPQQVQELDKI